jgi:hypothetical protein
MSSAPRKQIELLSLLRMTCMIGACPCFVESIRFIYEDIAYHITLDFWGIVFITVPIIPIVAVAPRYKKGFVVYPVIILLEIIIFALASQLRVR